MLLHDEHAGGHPAYRELLVALAADALDIDRPAVLAQERGERVDGRGVAFGMDLEPSVVGRPHPPQDAERRGTLDDALAQASVQRLRRGDTGADRGGCGHPGIVTAPAVGGPAPRGRGIGHHFTAPQQVPSGGTDAGSVAVGDLDTGDLKPDVVVGNLGDAGPRGLESATLDDNARPDLVVADFGRYPDGSGHGETMGSIAVMLAP